MIHRITNHVIFRYIISGGTSAVVDLSFLYLFDSVFHIHYLVSAVLAFLIAFGVSFTLHKTWTFKTEIHHDTRKQIALYLCTSLFGLLLNTFLMYIFVSHFHINVLLSQICVGALVACCTFFLSRNFVFKYDQNSLPLV